jgi:uncharacterized phage protein (TIGR01671 family)
MSNSRFKFRAWNGEAMEFGGFSIHACGGVVGSSLSKVEDGCNDVMQFTGLHDKNGVGIYESDIVKAESEYPAVIVFGGGAFCLSFIYPGYTGSWEAMRNIAMDRYEVIGNIHQNPELLNDNG